MRAGWEVSLIPANLPSKTVTPALRDGKGGDGGAEVSGGKFISVCGSYCIVAVVQSLSHDRLFAAPWTAAPSSSVHGILQARVLEWDAIAFSRFYL